MIISISKLHSPSDFPLTFELADFPRIEQLKFVQTLSAKGKVHLAKHSHSIDFLADYTLKAQASCGKCLESMEVAEEFLCSLALFSEKDWNATANRLELHWDNLDQDVFDGEEILVEKYIEDQILLDLPERLFCREDCLGLCAQCGANLNLAPCLCANVKQYNPFKDLKNF